jgi:hypothetical protein
MFQEFLCFLDDFREVFCPNALKMMRQPSEQQKKKVTKLVGGKNFRCNRWKTPKRSTPVELQKIFISEHFRKPKKLAKNRQGTENRTKSAELDVKTQNFDQMQKFVTIYL